MENDKQFQKNDDSIFSKLELMYRVSKIYLVNIRNRKLI